MIMNYVTNGRKALLAGVALVACLGFAFNAQAQTCTTDNWAGGVTGAPTVGKQDGDNRRYGGPCGMRTALDGSSHYVTDTSPSGELTYKAQFYVLLENPGTGPITLFEADDGTEGKIQVVFENDSIILSVRDTGGAWNDIPSGGVPVGSGWHSVNLEWEQAASAAIALSVDGAADETATIDTSGITIENAHLGNLNNGSGGGLIDFDDFDSRRSERPSRLMVGDANNDSNVNVFDIVANIGEIQAGTFAPGQPDCDENGTINVFDIVCQIDIIQN